MSHLEVELLLQLQNDEISIDSILKNSNYVSVIKNGSQHLLKQCILAAINVSLDDDKAILLLNHINQWIEEGEICSVKKNMLQESVLAYLVAKDDVDALKIMLSIMNYTVCYKPSSTTELKLELCQHDSKTHVTTPEENNIALIMACRTNNFDLVYALVSAGYR